MKEIGSDFWQAKTTENIHKYNHGQDTCYLLSGRTALDFIIKDIKVKYKARTAYLPSYCCHTMIEPFLSNGLKVCFYDVLVKDGNLNIYVDENMRCDVALIMQYFGYQDKNTSSIAKGFKDNNMTVIEDCTHSIFCRIPFGENADYIFASFRKWTGLECGAIASCMNDCFSIKKPNVTNEKYVTMRTNAMKDKELYVTGFTDNKNYLTKFGDAEETLERDYSLYKVDDYIANNIQTLDIEFIKLRRKNNVTILLNLIEGLDYINPLFQKVLDADCPLFFPIYVSKHLRNDLRRYLIKHDVYCPVHWPCSELHKISPRAMDLYNSELSISCDQRYSEAEMIIISELIKTFFLGK